MTAPLYFLDKAREAIKSELIADIESFGQLRDPDHRKRVEEHALSNLSDAQAQSLMGILAAASQSKDLVLRYRTHELIVNIAADHVRLWADRAIEARAVVLQDALDSDNADTRMSWAATDEMVTGVAA